MKDDGNWKNLFDEQADPAGKEPQADCDKCRGASGECTGQSPVLPERQRLVNETVTRLRAGTFLKATPTLAAHADAYAPGKKRARPSADPVGLYNLPEDRDGINRLLIELCCRLAVAGGQVIKGSRLVADLGLENDRALRLLIAYGRVHHHVRPIVGVYGGGYCWADLADNPTEFYELARAQARQTAKCHLFLCTLFARGDGAMGLIQTVFPFAKATAPGGDDLAALLTAKGIDHEQVLEAMIAHCRQAGPDGLAAIRRVASRNQDVMISADRLARIRHRLEQALLDLAQQPA